MLVANSLAISQKVLKLGIVSRLLIICLVSASVEHGIPDEKRFPKSAHYNRSLQIIHIILILTLHYNYILNSGDGKIKREDLQNLLEKFRKHIFLFIRSRTIAKMIKKVVVL